MLEDKSLNDKLKKQEEKKRRDFVTKEWILELNAAGGNSRGEPFSPQSRTLPLPLAPCSRLQAQMTAWI